MVYVITPYVITSALAAVLAVAVALLAIRRLAQPGGRSLTGLLLASAVWSGFTALEYAAVSIPAKVFWAKLEYLGVVTTPVMFFLLALEYSRMDRWLQRRWVALLFVLPAFNWLLVLTNDWHYLVWTRYTPDLTGRNLLVYGHGAWFWVGVIGYSYLLMAAGTVLLLRAIFHYPATYRSQTYALIGGTLVPWLGNVFYVAEVGVPPGFDPTSLLITFSGLLFAFGIFRLRLLDLAPVARQTVIESMIDAMFVLDGQKRVVDLNAAARRLAAGFPKDPIGWPLEQVLEGVPHAMDAICSCNGKHPPEFSMLVGDEQRYYFARVSRLEDPLSREIGRLIVLSDVTLARQAALLEERQRLAQELHDNLGQVLSYLALNAQSIREQVEQGSYAAAQGQLEALSLAAQSASRDVREYILDTRTQVESAERFTDVLKLYLKRYEMITGMETRLSLPKESIDAVLPETVYVHLLRMIQETLANARKHAHATQVQIIFSMEPDVLQVLVVDNGVGFAAAEAEGGFGLEIMRQRAEKAGAELEFRSAPGQGTQVLLKFTRLQADLVRASLGGLRVVLVDDHQLFAVGLRNLLEGRGLVVVGVGKDAEQAVRLAGELKPDLLLLDVHLPGRNGVQVVRPILETSPHTRVVMLSISADEHELVQALHEGAAGYLLKSQPPEDLFRALLAVQRGETPLAPGLAVRLAESSGWAGASGESRARQDLVAAGLSLQQVEILKRVAQGKVYKEIGADLHITESAVKYHMERIQSLLGAANRSEAVAQAVHMGLVPDRRAG